MRSFPIGFLTNCVGWVPGSHNASQEVDTATKIVDAGLTFLRAYSKLGSKAHKAGRPLWVFKPKIHYYHHLIHDMQTCISRGHRPLKPLAFSCAMAEDFIGRTSLLARRVLALCLCGMGELFAKLSSPTSSKSLLQRLLNACRGGRWLGLVVEGFGGFPR